MNEAQVIITTNELPLGRVSYSFQWEGEPNWPISISRYFLDEFPLETMPWPLMKVREGESILDDYAIYMRKDGHWAIYAWFTKARYSIKRFLQPIYCRLIITAMVWGLAYVPEATVPSWRNLGRKRAD